MRLKPKGGAGNYAGGSLCAQLTTIMLSVVMSDLFAQEKSTAIFSPPPPPRGEQSGSKVSRSFLTVAIEAIMCMFLLLTFMSPEHSLFP